MRLTTIFLTGSLFYGTLCGLQCHFSLFEDIPTLASQAAAEHHVEAVLPVIEKAAIPIPTRIPTQTKPEPEPERTELPIKDYVQQAIGLSHQLAMLYWNSSGMLDLPPLIEQCHFRNFSEPSQWPFFLQNLRIHHGQGSSTSKLALYPQSDNTEDRRFNWSFPAPIPLIAHSLPLEIANHPNRYPWIRLFPTPYELRGNAKSMVDRVLACQQYQIPFPKRKNQLLYRASEVNQMSPMNQRTQVIQMGQQSNNQKWLNASDTNTNPLPVGEQTKFKYMLDIGGLSGTTWTALRWKMCSKSLVFKVDSGYADWWHALLQPMVHYIPVKKDLSDLYTQYQWAEEHPIQAETIAQHGAQLCLQTTDLEYLRNYTRHQIESMPTPTANHMGQYYTLLEDSRRRLHEGKPPLLFRDNKRFTQPQKYPCQPKLTPNNI